MSEQDLIPQVPGEAQETAPEPETVEPKPKPKPKPKAEAEVMPESKSASGGLPEASSIDSKKITRAVLTRQGWVCPDKSDSKAGA